jgi:hypothetical protein
LSQATSLTWHESSKGIPSVAQRSELGGLFRSAGDGRDQHDLVAILEGVGVAAEEADVFVVDVDIDEAAEFPGFVLDLGGKCGEFLVDVGDQAGEIDGVAGELLLAIGMADEGGREDDLDGNGVLLLGSW